MNKSIFISYGWESDEASDAKVKSFAQWLAVYLTQWGFDVHLDTLDTRPGSDLEAFMKQGIDNSHFVICLCTNTYLKKVTDETTGVYNEIELIKHQSSSPFIIPIIEHQAFVDLPDFFKGKYVSQLRFDVPFSRENKDGLVELISTLYDDVFSNKESETRLESKNRMDSYRNRLGYMELVSEVYDLMNFDVQLEGNISFPYLNDGGHFKIGLSPMDFITRWSTAGSTSIYSYKESKFIKYMMKIPNFENFDKITKPEDIDEDKGFSVKWSTSLNVGDGIVWVNNNDMAAIGKIIEINMDPDNDDKSMVTLAYKILNPIDLTDDFINASNKVD